MISGDCAPKATPFFRRSLGKCMEIRAQQHSVEYEGILDTATSRDQWGFRGTLGTVELEFAS